MPQFMEVCPYHLIRHQKLLLIIFLSLNKKYKKKIIFQFIKFGPVLTTQLSKTKSKIWLKKNKKKIISIEKATKKFYNYSEFIFDCEVSMFYK